MIRFLILVIFITGCSVNELKPRSVDKYSQGPKFAKYYLPNLPDWANISNSGSCKRKYSSKYLKLRSLRDDFSFGYDELVQFQYLYNIEYRKLIKQADRGILPYTEEEKLFYDVFDKIKTKIYAFRRPTYKRVNLVWVDGIKLNKLKKLMKSKAMNDGHPVFVSLCLSGEELVDYIQSIGYSNKDIRILSFEIFTPYNKNILMSGKTSLDFSKLFAKKQRLYFYTPSGTLPPEFIGNFRVRKF